MAQTQYHLLKVRRFLPLFATQFCNALNDNIFKNALVILIAYQISLSPTWQQHMVTLAGGIFILPFFLFSALAGEIADKFDMAMLIRIIKSMEIFIMLIAFLGFFWHHLWLLLISLFLLGTHSTFFGPIKYAILPYHLKERELIGGNALIEAGTFTAILIGQILGGSLIIQPSGSILTSIVLIDVAILGLAFSFLIPHTVPAQPNLHISWHIIRKTAHILRLSRQKYDIFIVILAISWFWFIGATILAGLPIFIKHTLHATASVFTLALTIFSLGIGTGSLLCNSLLKGNITLKYSPIALMGISLFILDLYLITRHPLPGQFPTLVSFLASLTHWRILIDLLLMSICVGLYIVPLYAYLQTQSEKTIRARIIASNNVMNALFMVCSALFMLSLTALHLTTTTIFLVLAGCNLWVAYLLHRFIAYQSS